MHVSSHSGNVFLLMTENAPLLLVQVVIAAALFHELVHFGGDSGGHGLERSDRVRETAPHRVALRSVAGTADRLGPSDGAFVEAGPAHRHFAVKDRRRVSTLRAIHDSQCCTPKITNGLQTAVNFCASPRDNVHDAQERDRETAVALAVAFVTACGSSVSAAR